MGLKMYPFSHRTVSHTKLTSGSKRSVLETSNFEFKVKIWRATPVATNVIIKLGLGLTLVDRSDHVYMYMHVSDTKKH